MSYTLTIRKEAELDIDEQFDYYEEKREGLGHDYLLCIEDALDKLQRNPLVYRKIHKELRRIPIRRFPYRIFYFVQNNNVIVTAVFHARKDPTSWNGRT
jgi:plasmid stabilization system protein ParE